MLDFSKKRTMPLILGDGTRLDLRTPTAEEYIGLTQIGGEVADYVKVCAIILNHNAQGQIFTEDEVKDSLLIDEMVILITEYLAFVSAIKDDDPNSVSRLAQMMAMTGTSATIR